MADENFLNRWSRRKLQARAAPTAAEPERPVDSSATPAGALPAAPTAKAELPPEQRGAAQAPQDPTLTLEDVAALTPKSDFRRFMGPGVAPEVRSAAMKKLFADPHFNVMDGLDVYIDDYTRPDPLPAAMLNQIASMQFLRAFEAPEQLADSTAARSVAPSPSVDQGVLEAPPEAPSNANPDLRLQQDDAAPGEEPGHGVA